MLRARGPIAWLSSAGPTLWSLGGSSDVLLPRVALVSFLRSLPKRLGARRQSKCRKCARKSTSRTWAICRACEQIAQLLSAVQGGLDRVNERSRLQRHELTARKDRPD